MQNQMSPGRLDKLKAALARTEATLAATSGKRNGSFGTTGLQAPGGAAGFNSLDSSSSSSSTHNSAVAPTSPAVARLLRQHNLTSAGMPLDPSGLPEFDDRSLLAHKKVRVCVCVCVWIDSLLASGVYWLLMPIVLCGCCCVLTHTRAHTHKQT